jgi:hypothetical protein
MNRKEVLRGCLVVLGAALIGLLVPISTRFASERFYTTADTVTILGRIGHEMFGEGLFLLSAINALPFAIACALIEATRTLIPRLRSAMGWFRLGLFPLLVAVTSASSLAVWNDLYGPGKPSSTAVLGFVVVPAYATIGAVAAYALTLVIIGAKAMMGEGRS